jgi:recombination protein RecA
MGRIPSQKNAAIQVTPEAKQVILGSILGDGHLEHPYPPTVNYGLEIKHSLSQEKYLRWKASILGSLVGKFDYPKNRIRMRTVRHPYFTELASKIVVNGRKSVPIDVFESIGPLGFGIWYLDDGNMTAEHMRPSGYRDYLTLRIASCAFTPEENLYLRELLQRKIGVETTKATWSNKGKRYEGIRIYKKHAGKFLDFIRDAVYESKLPYKLT